ncbi:MAG: class II fructose-bisphosphate aldolase [Candidatus Taylorbacteria bacterium]|nr:class II fructose-bisphosphate aldolase [Candidatus Taylorbacteria bacterium]
MKEYIEEAREKAVAIGHFNISNSDGFWAVVLGAKEVGVPVIIGASEGERDFIGVRELAAMVKAYRDSTGQPVFLNADHTYSFERVKEVIDAGYDAVIYDGTELSIEENILITKKCVEYAKSVNPAILVEAEIGFIGKSSKLLDMVPYGVGRLTTVEEASYFVKETGVDMLAPAVGNVHGMVKGGEPALNIERIAEIADATLVPVVLHGASGNSPEDIKNAIKAGISIIHINTELRVAFRAGLIKTLQENPDEIAPYKYLKGARLAMQKVVEEKLRLFNNF